MTVERSRVIEIETLSASINEFTRSLEQRVEERTVQLKEQQLHLIKEVELRKAAEKTAHVAAAKATAANEAKSQIMANMSHEIRTPLNGIIGGTQLLGIMGLDKKAEAWVNTIEDSANRLLSLVNAVLDYSDIDVGQFSLSSDVFQTDTLLRECRSMFMAEAVSKNIDLRFDIDPELPKQLVGDSMRIQQVLTNLLGNAIKFTKAGSIVMRASIENLEDCAIKIKWEITDTGIGIPKDRFQNIFDSFEQVDNGDTRKYGGSGLGLSISRELARMMRGDITLESEIGVGSTFHCMMILGVAEESYSEKPSSLIEERA
jgi:signal transduction histidine kinase